MKRLLLILLILALVGPGTALASGRGFLRGVDTEPEPGTDAHLLLGIPFGSSAEEVTALVWEKTGLVLGTGTDQWGDAALMTADTPPVEMLGYRARLVFSLDGEERLKRVAVYFQDDDTYMMARAFPLEVLDPTEDIFDLLTEYDLVHEALRSRYGPPEGGLMAVQNGSVEAIYDYPGGTWGLDTVLLSQAAAENEDCGFVSRFGNVFEIATVRVGEAPYEAPEFGQRAEMRMMLVLLRDAADLAEILPDEPAIEGFSTPGGEYNGKAVQIEL